MCICWRFIHTCNKDGEKNPEINQLKKSTLTETNNQIPKLRVVVVLLVLAYGDKQLCIVHVVSLVAGAGNQKKRVKNICCTSLVYRRNTGPENYGWQRTNNKEDNQF